MTFLYNQNWLEATRRGVERYKQGFMFQVQQIPEQTFRVADERKRILLLLTQFEKLMTGSGVNLKDNLLCPYHEDQHPSMTYYPDSKKFYCHSRCFEEEVILNDGTKKYKVHKDGLDIVHDLLDLTSFDETYNTLVSWFVENPQQFFRSRQFYRKPPGKKNNYRSSTKEPTQSVLATEDREVKEFLNDRGIDDNMILLFKLGAHCCRSVYLSVKF